MIIRYQDVNTLMSSIFTRPKRAGRSANTVVRTEVAKSVRGRRVKVDRESSTMNAVKSVERALAILKTFDDNSPFLTAQEIASRIGIPRPSVYRFLKTLSEQGFLVEVGDTELRRFSVGSAVLGLSKLAFGQGELRRVAQPIMQLAAEKSGESIYISVRHGSQAVCIENFDGQAPLRYGGRVGNTYPLYAGSPKVILAFLDEKMREHLIGQMTFKAITKTTITNREDLIRRLFAIRRRGYEVSNGEMFPETCAISAPVFDQKDDVIAVLSIGAPRGRVTAKNKEMLAAIVVEAARAITRGCRRQSA